MDLTPVARRRVLVLWDARGSGRSTADARAASPSFEQDVRDLETVRAQLGIGRMVLVGHGYGAAVALAYAAAHPAHAFRLVLYAPIEMTHARDLARADTLAAIAARDSAGSEALATLAARLGEGGADSLARCRAEWTVALRRLGVGDEGVRRRRDDPCSATGRPGPTPAVWEGTRRSMGDWNLRSLAAEVGVAALVVDGARYPWAAATAREWGRALPNARVWLVEDAAHAYAHLDQPARFFAGLDQFLRGFWPAGSVAERR